MTRVVGFVLLIVASLGALYVGAAGLAYFEIQQLAEKVAEQPVQPGDKAAEFKVIVGYNGHEPIESGFSSPEAAVLFLRLRLAEKLFPGFQNLTRSILLTIAAIAFGYVGGTGGLLRRLSSGQAVGTVELFACACFGAFCGLLSVAAGFIFPAVLTSHESTELRPTAVLFLALFAGAFSNQFFDWCSKRFFKDHKEG